MAELLVASRHLLGHPRLHLGAVGDPLGNDPANRHGTSFNLHNGALFIAELQYSIGQAEGDSTSGKHDDRLPGTYKIGAWYNNERFGDLRFDTAGRSLADPATTGVPRVHRGDVSLYAVADQTVWRASPGSSKALGVCIASAVTAGSVRE